MLRSLEGRCASYVSGSLWGLVGTGRARNTILLRLVAACPLMTNDLPAGWLGLYPAIIKEFAAHEKANPVIFSFYRQVPLILCNSITSRGQFQVR